MILVPIGTIAIIVAVWLIMEGVAKLFDYRGIP